MRLLDGLDGDQGQVVYEAYFALDEGFAVLDSGEEAVVAGFGEGAFADFFFGGHCPAAGWRTGIGRP